MIHLNNVTMKILVAIFLTSTIMLSASCNHAQSMKQQADPNQNFVLTPKGDTIPKVVKTEAQWKIELTPTQYSVLRESATERPYTGEYWDNHEAGRYYCRACSSPLFDSDTKFDSGCGWPSFFKAVNDNAIKEIKDSTLGMVRTEIRCAVCDSHLGHVFDDGPPPTGLRYCMNSASMRFEKN